MANRPAYMKTEIGSPVFRLSTLLELHLPYALFSEWPWSAQYMFGHPFCIGCFDRLQTRRPTSSENPRSSALRIHLYPALTCLNEREIPRPSFGFAACNVRMGVGSMTDSRHVDTGLALNKGHAARSFLWQSTARFVSKLQSFQKAHYTRTSNSDILQRQLPATSLFSWRSTLQCSCVDTIIHRILSNIHVLIAGRREGNFAGRWSLSSSPSF